MARDRGTRRRDLLWLDTLVQTEVGALATTNTTGSTSTTVAPSALGRATIVRVRGSYQMLLDPSAAEDVKMIGLGLIIATDVAITAGAASLPSPTEDPDAPWLWVVYHTLVSGDATAQNGADINQAVRGVIDSKAMRRVTTNENLVFLIDAVNNGGTPVANVSGVARVLIQEG